MFYRRQIPARSISLFLADIGMVFLAMCLGSLIRLGWQDGWEKFLDHIPTGIGFSILFTLVFFAAGLYDSIVLSRPLTVWVSCLCAVAIGSMLSTLSFYVIFRIRHFGLGINLLTCLILFLGVWSIRYFYRLVVGSGFFSRSSLLVGEGQALLDILQLLENRDTQPLFRVMGIVLPTGNAENSKFIMGVPVLGHLHDLGDFVEAYEVETILIAMPRRMESDALQNLRPLRYRGIELLDYIGLHELLAQSIPLDHIDDEWLMHAAMNSSRLHIRKIKRVLDSLVAALGLLLTLPISLLAMVAVRLDSPGPVFYRQRRLGLGGQPYTVMKFRTMRVDAELESGAVWAEKFDARITRVGRFLRSARIDEIPQLLNVLRGQMSLVGPRPERPEFVKNLRQTIPFYEERLMMPPGITGWAQVRFPYAASVEAARMKLQYDLYYIKHTSLLFDLSILLKTFKTILVGMRHSEDPAVPRKPDLQIMPDTRHSTG